MVGDELNCYGRVTRVGRTSVTVGIEAWVRRYLTDAPHKVTEGVFTYVAINAQRQPRPSNTWGWHRDDHPDWA